MEKRAIGAGIYANKETYAVSCAGSGEFFIKGLVVYDIGHIYGIKAQKFVKAQVVNGGLDALLRFR